VTLIQFPARHCKRTLLEQNDQAVTPLAELQGMITIGEAAEQVVARLRRMRATNANVIAFPEARKRALPRPKAGR
jgi:hypothetical protein